MKNPLKSTTPFFSYLGSCLGLAGLALLFSHCGKPGGSDEETPLTPVVVAPSSSPSPAPAPYPNFRGQEFHGERNFATLINTYQQGKIEPTPWAGFWWPYLKNGIAAASFFGNDSPAGKYDAARGRTTHAQEWEVSKHGARVPHVQQWWGHCNGWCAAAALFPEPTQPVTVNGITFGIGDIKALLSEGGMSANADFYGDRIDVDDSSSPKYWDTVPDQYFLVLTNYIGKLKQAVLIDRYTGGQIWNQPLAGYRLEYPKPEDYLGSSVEAPHVYKIVVTSTLWWLDDGVAPDVQTHAFNFEEEDPTGIVQSRVLRMEVWLDAPVVFDSAGKIKSSGDVIVTREGENLVGGAWRMGEGYLVDAWPDYMWVPYSLIKPTDPDQDYVNPEVDMEWIKTHILTPGGQDDTSVTPGPIEPAPRPQPSGLPFPPSSGGSGSGFPGSSGGFPGPGLPYPPSGGGSSGGGSTPGSGGGTSGGGTSGGGFHGPGSGGGAPSGGSMPFPGSGGGTSGGGTSGGGFHGPGSGGGTPTSGGGSWTPFPGNPGRP